ncbi:NAD-dependent epimerase/dehydratase family protein [Methylophaga sp. SB9B]|uniref:NAD-dependent epimerase/dehydratase family protein n=1 Tax=Methylophaga sp. SB9B TaxID=2570356 RepID=UPI0010A7B906|nr:NAD-dependent epimerase/dehydratase family protein [Methylophaga sp. SB9B]THK43291.1 NAD-dependent epimerase/dehydratase family protein [Methylophaga sp. SB9B]
MSQMSQTKTLVIGGAGFIGSYLVPELINSGRTVTVLGRKKLPRYLLPERAKYVQGDFSDLELICNLLDKHQEVIHLAYATVPNTSFDDPLSDLLQNLPPSVQLFKEMADRGIKLILVSSGGTVYGEARQLPIDETHQTKPISPYGVTKLTLENYAYLYAATHGLKFVCVRPANAYGIGQYPFTGQGFIATAIASVLAHNPIKIFGQRGTVRDYIYVSDLASGIVSALEHGRLSELYNLGSGVGLSNLDVIELFTPILKNIGLSVHIENLPERSFDVQSNVLDSSKLQKHTGWNKKVNFTDGIDTTFEWIKELQK